MTGSSCPFPHRTLTPTPDEEDDDEEDEDSTTAFFLLPSGVGESLSLESPPPLPWLWVSEDLKEGQKDEVVEGLLD